MRAPLTATLLTPRTVQSTFVMPFSNVAPNRLMHIKIIDDPDQAWLLLLLRLLDRE